MSCRYFLLKCFIFLGLMMDKSLQTEVEAATFRRLTAHLQKNLDVQNIELMLLADFCRNCLAKWLVASAAEREIMLDYEDARKQVYGMPYTEWKTLYQKKATAEQLAAYAEKQKQK